MLLAKKLSSDTHRHFRPRAPSLSTSHGHAGRPTLESKAPLPLPHPHITRPIRPHAAHARDIFRTLPIIPVASPDILAQHGWHGQVDDRADGGPRMNNKKRLGASFLFSRGAGDLASTRRFAAPRSRTATSRSEAGRAKCSSRPRWM
jgi:hypothetical protein